MQGSTRENPAIIPRKVRWLLLAALLVAGAASACDDEDVRRLKEELHYYQLENLSLTAQLLDRLKQSGERVDDKDGAKEKENPADSGGSTVNHRGDH